MISKEKFIEYMEQIVNFIEKENNIDKALKELSLDFGGFSYGDLISLTVQLLKDLTNDKGDWIDYYIWELDLGKNGLGDITDIDGSIIPLKTFEDLYNILKDNKENE